MIHANALSKIRIVDDRPNGYLMLQDITSYTDRAFSILHYRWSLWVPKKAVVRWKNQKNDWEYAVARWAVDSAKNHPTATQLA